MLREIKSIRHILGCTVLTMLTSDGVFGYVAIPGLWEIGQFADALARILMMWPELARVKGRQL